MKTKFKMINNQALNTIERPIRVNVSGIGRFYQFSDGRKYPSVTTVLSEYKDQGLQAFRSDVGEDVWFAISERAARHGTHVHELVENYLRGKPFDDLYPIDRWLLAPLRRILDENVSNIYGIEQLLYSDRLQVAGTADIIADWKGEPAILDVKTSSRLKSPEEIQTYFAQISVYAYCYNERTKSNIKKGVILMMPEAEENVTHYEIGSEQMLESMEFFLKLKNKFNNIHA